jgi:hypothetical protein
MKRIIMSAALALGAHFSAFAADDATVKFLLGGGLTYGGDKLATVGFTDGSSENIRAGSLLMLYGGAEVRLGDLVSFQTTLGYHTDDTSQASNGKVRFSRIPVDLLLHFRMRGPLRLGAGMQLVHNAELKGSGSVSFVNAKFDDAVGAVLEGEYLFSPHLGLKLRYVSEEFELRGSNVTVDGSHIGMLFNYYF